MRASIVAGIAIAAVSFTAWAESPTGGTDIQLRQVRSAAANPSPRGYLQALIRAYPGRVTDLQYHQGDWSIRVDGRRVYWAEGRLMSERTRSAWENFDPLRFYNYQPYDYQIRPVSPERADRIRAIVSDMERDPPRRHNAFLGRLYGFLTEGEAAEHMVWVDFLNVRTQVHRYIAPVIRSADRQLQRLMVDDDELLRFVNSLWRVDGFNFRPIAATESLSFHAFGVAIDLIPEAHRRTYAYWRWAMDAGVDSWWELEQHERWPVPEVLITVLENHGFVWGGKWTFFDTMHFEYRPELMILAGYDPILPQDDRSRRAGGIRPMTRTTW